MKKKIAVLALCFATFLAACQSMGQERAAESESAVTAASEAAGAEAAVTAEAAEATDNTGTAESSDDTGTAESTEGTENVMEIQIAANGNTITFQLNDSSAAKDLYRQLPLTVENEDFSNNEKTFYPPEKLNVSDAPHTDGSIGTLAYYEPWGDVVLFYGAYNPNGSLYALGKVTSGAEFISQISGEMVITAAE